MLESGKSKIFIPTLLLFSYNGLPFVSSWAEILNIVSICTDLILWKFEAFRRKLFLPEIFHKDRNIWIESHNSQYWIVYIVLCNFFVSAFPTILCRSDSTRKVCWKLKVGYGQTFMDLVDQVCVAMRDIPLFSSFTANISRK